jgi:hypothetical protein
MSGPPESPLGKVVLDVFNEIWLLLSGHFRKNFQWCIFSNLINSTVVINLRIGTLLNMLNLE